MQLDELARANAIQLECTKVGAIQRKNGDWQLRINIAQEDMDQRLIAASIGTRFACLLIQVIEEPAPVKTGNKWADLGPARQAGMLCKEPVFWAFLREECGGINIHDEEAAAAMVRDICCVASRSELGHPGKQRERVLWHQLDEKFQGWKAAEHA